MTHSNDFLSEVKKDWSKFHIKVTYNAEGLLDRPQIHTSAEAADVLIGLWDMDLIGMQEQFVCLFLNNQHRLLGWRLISTGSVSAIAVNVKLVAAVALHTMAQYVIIAHNHPSGNLSASQSDKVLTMQLETVLKLIDTKLSDHLILGPDGGYFSFNDSGIV